MVFLLVALSVSTDDPVGVKSIFINKNLPNLKQSIYALDVCCLIINRKNPYLTGTVEYDYKVMENNDYDGWSKLIEGRGRAVEVVNEENFSRFTEARRLAQEGRYEEADAIREELGLRTRDGARIGAGKGMMNEYRGQRKGGR